MSFTAFVNLKYSLEICMSKRFFFDGKPRKNMTWMNPVFSLLCAYLRNLMSSTKLQKPLL